MIHFHEWIIGKNNPNTCTYDDSTCVCMGKVCNVLRHLSCRYDIACVCVCVCIVCKVIRLLSCTYDIVCVCVCVCV
jgi:hypothetical protein